MTDTATTSPRRRTGARIGLGIQSKLLIMLLLVAIVSIAVTGVIGYVNGRASLNDAALKQLTTIRELRTTEVEATISTLQTGALLDSRTSDTVDASEAFNAAFDELDEEEEAYPAEREAALDFYRTSFVPELEKRTGKSYDAEGMLPASAAGRYLQGHYTINSADFDAALQVMDAGDGSDWSIAHAAHHPYFKGLIDELGYEDILLTNTRGEIVYSAYKGVDLGIDLFADDMAQTSLSKAVASILKSDSLDTTVMTDFERYLPSLDVPTSWILSPVGTPGHITGVMAVQVPITTLNNTLTGNQGWASQGLGASGEVYIVGADHYMRSASRALLDSPDTYAEQAIANGLAPATAQRILDVDGTVLLQPVDTVPAERALQGKSGTSMAAGYLGTPKLSSYAPLTIDNGPQWVIIASMDESEAFAPVDVFTRIVLLSAGALVLIVAVLALLLARVFTRPLDKLMAGVRRVSSGERDVEVDTKTRDEFAELGGAFNELSRSLQIKADLLDAERAESERMLLSLMPATVAERYRQGDETIAEDHTDVAVIYADIAGFDDYAAEMDSAHSLASLNEIVTGLDELAVSLGIERVRTTKQGYLASCGLSVPRVDSARRVVEFAAGAQQLVSRLSNQWGAQLALRAGIDSGSVTTGLVGRNSVVYDMWGEAVNLAYRLESADDGAGVVITQRVVDRLGDMFPVIDAGLVETTDGPLQTWRLDPETARV